MTLTSDTNFYETLLVPIQISLRRQQSGNNLLRTGRGSKLGTRSDNLESYEPGRQIYFMFNKIFFLLIHEFDKEASRHYSLFPDF